MHYIQHNLYLLTCLILNTYVIRHEISNVWMRICVSNSVTNVGYNFTAGTFKRLNLWVHDINFTMQENVN